MPRGSAHRGIKSTLSCTSLPCSWLPPSFQSVSYAKIADIDFSRPKNRKRHLPDAASTSNSSTTTSNQSQTSSKKTKRPIATEPTATELEDLYTNLSKIKNCKPGILSVVPRHCDRYIPLCKQGVLPPPLTDLFAKENLNLLYPDLLQECDQCFCKLSISPEHCTNIEKHTRDQAHSKLWFQQRAGRITASRFKAAACTDPALPSQSLVKSICYPEDHRFSTKGTQWGCAHERTAYQAYIHQCTAQHTRFEHAASGLIVTPAYPFLGASPDGTVSCECCGTGVLEIKCPYSCKEKSILEASSEAKFFLEKKNDGIFLKQNHQYYYQVQAQIKLSNANYCDFVVWREKELFVQRIYPNDEFMAPVLQKLISFYKLCVLPELLGKWYTKSQVPSQPTSVVPSNVWCYCRKEQEGLMIGCERKECPIVWFHTNCLKIEEIPKGKWYCPDCRKKK